LIRIAFALIGSLAFGALLAAADWPFPAGALGAATVVVGAVVSRRVWDQRRKAERSVPGWREVAAWHALIGWGVVCGQLAMALARGVDLHIGQDDRLAFDNWLLGVAAVVAWLVVRPRDRTRDERDREIDALGARVGFWTLLGLLAVASPLIGLAPVAIQERLTPFVIGNILIVLLLLGALAYSTAQLVGYWIDARPGDGLDA